MKSLTTEITPVTPKVAAKLVVLSSRFSSSLDAAKSSKFESTRLKRSPENSFTSRVGVKEIFVTSFALQCSSSSTCSQTSLTTNSN